MTARRRWALAAGTGALALAAATLPANALGLTVVKDPWTLAQATETVEQLAKQYRTMTDQLATARAQAQALTSHSGFGELLNGGSEQSARRYMPDAWAAAVDSSLTASGGGDSAALEQAKRLYRPVSPETFDPAHPNSVEAERYRQDSGTALAVFAGSRAMLDRVGPRRDTYEALLAKVEAAPDSKAAADLSNRIEAENGLTQNELVRATAMQTHIAAVQELRLASAKAASARAAKRARINLSGGAYAPAS